MFNITGFEPLDLMIIDSYNRAESAINKLWEMSDEELAEYTDFNELCSALGIDDPEELMLNDLVDLTYEMKKRGFKVDVELA